MHRLHRRLVASLLVLSGALTAQQNVGISVVGPLSPSLTVYCGFDCGNASNTGRVVGVVGQSVDVRLFGDAGMPAVVAIGIGPAFTQCPGIGLPGIHNSLQILPPNILAAVGTASLAPGSRTCSASGASIVIPGLAILAAASGATLTFQGLVFDTGTPAFTRPVEMVVR